MSRILVNAASSIVLGLTAMWAPEAFAKPLVAWVDGAHQVAADAAPTAWQIAFTAPDASPEVNALVVFLWGCCILLSVCGLLSAHAYVATGQRAPRDAAMRVRRRVIL